MKNRKGGGNKLIFFENAPTPYWRPRDNFVWTNSNKPTKKGHHAASENRNGPATPSVIIQGNERQ